jgi:pterin-4a-carbinolamine dehydratase
VERTFVFKDFSQAWGWMSRAALMAEKVGQAGCWIVLIWLIA